MKRFIVCGDRYLKDYHRMEEVFTVLRDAYGAENVKIIEGGANGADGLAYMLARKFRFHHRVFKAKWERYGKQAGPIRNREMLKKGKPYAVLAFHDNLKQSKGTLDMIFAANAAGVTVSIYTKQR